VFDALRADLHRVERIRGAVWSFAACTDPTRHADPTDSSRWERGIPLYLALPSILALDGNIDPSELVKAETQGGNTELNELMSTGTYWRDPCGLKAVVHPCE